MLLTLKYITIIYLTMGCHNASREGILCIKNFLTTLYVTKSYVCKLFINRCITIQQQVKYVPIK